MRTCRPVGPERLFADCRNAAPCESLGHLPRNRCISNTKALKGQNCGRASSFRPVGAVCGSIYFSQGDALGFRILGLWPRRLSTLLRRTSSGRICDQGMVCFASAAHTLHESLNQHTAIDLRLTLQHVPRSWPQWRGLKEFDWRAGYVSALIFASSGTNQGINIPRSP